MQPLITVNAYLRRSQSRTSGAVSVQKPFSENRYLDPVGQLSQLPGRRVHTLGIRGMPKILEQD